MLDFDNLTAIDAITGGKTIALTEIEVIKGGVATTVWRAEQTVFEATMGQGYSEGYINVSSKNTNYVSVANFVFCRCGGNEEDDSNYTSATLLTLTNAAVSDYTYADVTLGYYHNSGYGDSDIRLDGVSVGNAGSYQTITQTVTLSSKRSWTCEIEVEDRSSGTTVWSEGCIAPIKVVLRR